MVKQKWSQGHQARALHAQPEMRYVSPWIRAYWQPDSPMNCLSQLPASHVTAAHESLPFEQRAMRALHG